MSVAYAPNTLRVDGTSTSTSTISGATTGNDMYAQVSVPNDPIVYKTPSNDSVEYVYEGGDFLFYTETGDPDFMTSTPITIPFLIACSENYVTDLNKIIQPYNYTNSLNNGLGFGGYTISGYGTQDAQHTVGGYNGVWFRYHIKNMVFSSVVITVPNYTNGISGIAIIGFRQVNGVTISEQISKEVYYDYSMYQVTSHIFECNTGYRYGVIYVVITQVCNASFFEISSIQFLQRAITVASDIGVGAVGPVTVGSQSQTMNLAYSSLTVNGTPVNLPPPTVMYNDTYPPTSTSTMVAPSVNVVTQLYNAMVATPTFYVKYGGTITVVGGATVQIIGNANMALQASSLNGIVAGSYFVSNTFQFPYKGIYSVTIYSTSNNNANTFAMTLNGTLGINLAYGPLNINSTVYNATFFATTTDTLRITDTASSIGFSLTSIYVITLVTRLA